MITWNGSAALQMPRAEKIYIGCNDDGEVVGLSNSRKLLEDIPNKIRNAMSIVVDVNLLMQDGKEYIEIVVPQYPVAISCKGAYYYRSGSTMQTLSGPELESFILRKRGASWDNMPLPGLTVDDIDDSLVDKFKKLAAKKGRIDKSVLEESKANLMEKLRLTNAGYYTNAAMLLFSKNPDKWQLGAYTKIGYFETDADLRYQDEIHGSLLEQIDKIMEVLYLKFMKAKISYEGIQRIERYFVADEALREALLNALCHGLWKAFHKRCYAKLIIIKVSSGNPFKIGGFGTFNFAYDLTILQVVFQPVDQIFFLFLLYL